MDAHAGHMRGLILALSCVLVGVLGFSVESALAAAPPVVESEWVTEVSSSSAQLAAEIDPGGGETTYHFEYGTTESYGHSTPESLSIGSEESGHQVAVHVQSLQAATVYHYRVVASNSSSPVGGTPGPDQTFTTHRTGEAVVLPDARQWELVSPPVKTGGNILPANEESFIQAADNGDAISYTSFLSPLEANPAGFAVADQAFSWRGATGWSSRDINAPHETATGIVAGNGGEYKFFSSDLSLALLEPFGDGHPPLSAMASERTMYVRNDAPLAPETSEQALYGEAEAQAPAGSHVGYLPLVTPADVPSGTKFGGRFPFGVKFDGASPDMTHVIIDSEVGLTAKAAAAGIGGLYEWSGGQPQLVSVLPGASEEPVNGGLGAGEEGARNAVSTDGSRVVWSTGNLYMRDTVRGETLQLDAAEAGCGVCGNGGGQLQFASSDGSKVFFTDYNQLLAGPSKSGNDLYECEIVENAGKLACDLTDLAPLTSSGDAAVLSPIIGASDDGAYVYIVAEGVHAEGASIPHSLYVLHDSNGAWTTRLIAKLSEGDAPDWTRLTEMPARVSPDGRYLVFMSQRSLTGYDNLDANSSQPDEEVYLYHAETSGSGQLEPGHLICASCDPSGARPVGAQAESPPKQLINDIGIWPPGTGLAADVPGWVGIRGRRMPRYQPRYLSDSGRLFFNGVDPLVSQAANGVADVYEYEPVGVGGCTNMSPTFGVASNGCVVLVSAASSGEESVFLDASENGDDVFFLTSVRLADLDLDTAFDVYDAHVCSVSVPCQAAVVFPPPCSTADSCRAAPMVQPAIFGAPSSATFSGAGNVAPSPPAVVKAKSKPAKCKRAFVKKRGRCVKRKRTAKKAASRFVRKSVTGKGSK